MEQREHPNPFRVGDVVVYKEDGPWERHRGKEFRVVNPHGYAGDTKAASVVPSECPTEEEDSKIFGLPRGNLTFHRPTRE